MLNNRRVPRTVQPPQTVTPLTRRDIFDYLTMGTIAWHGRLDETAFLERIWDLGSLPSTDGRFPERCWRHLAAPSQ